MDNKRSNKPEFFREKIPSMKRRSVHNNYYSRHIYMLTLVVEGRRPILGKLVGNIKDEDDPPRIELSALGKAVQECWENIPKHHPEAKCLGFQIMPDHLHGILFVERNMEDHLGQIVSGFKAGCNKAYRGLYSEAVPLNTDKQAVPMNTDKQAVPMNTNRPSACYTASPYSDLPLPSVMRLKKDDRSKGLLFERGYNDLINKNYDMLPRIVNYVNDNPRRLAIKRAYPDFFKVRFGISIGQQTYAGIGNKFLLDYPEKIQVKCSRKLTDEEIKDAINSYLEKARSGAVLVSPAISKGEQAVMRTALNEGLPIIFLTPWGFTAFSKPGHQYFNACADGRLLILAPWEHQTERIALTRDMCLLLNDMATEICRL
ncbi:MAG: transposase [Bacteroidaceae bacterium]|nr:transposase [Bacteroidaceae bacterium]